MPQTIALVDDDRNILTSVSDDLGGRGILGSRLYRRGPRPLRALVAQPVDLAVLDIKMRMDGMELLENSGAPAIFR